MKIILLSVSMLALLGLFLYARSAKVGRKLLYDNERYTWKIYHVTENYFPAGKFQHYEVFYRNKQLVLPKEMTGGVGEISQFHAAGAFDAGQTNYGSVVLIFEARIQKADGFEERNMVSLFIRTDNSRLNQLEVVNLCTGKTATISFE
jgi:hypothetical protein